MKKVLLSVACIALVGMTAKAQDPAMRMGVKGGANYTWLEIKQDEGETASSGVNGWGWNAGIYFEKNFSDKIGVRPELLLSGRNVKQKETILGNEVEFSTAPLYLEIPVLINFNINPQFSIHLGPEFDLMLSNTVKVDGEKSDEGSTTEGLNTFQMGAALGFSWEMESGLNFGFRFIRDFTPINEDMEGDGNLKMKNHVIQVGVGYSIKKS